MTTESVSELPFGIRFVKTDTAVKKFPQMFDDLQLLLRDEDSPLGSQALLKIHSKVASIAKLFHVEVIDLTDTYAVTNTANLARLVNFFGFDAEELFPAWSASHSALAQEGDKALEGRPIIGKLASRYEENFLEMCIMEARRRDSARVLYNEYGIKSFARYGSDVLIDQYDHRSDLQTPYGLVMVARADHNTAFYNSSCQLSHLNQQLGKDFRLRVTEVEDEKDVIRKLVRMHRRYGPRWDRIGHRISFGLLGGHGSIGSIQIGDGKHQELTLDDLKSYRKMEEEFTRVEPSIFFEEDATLILNSCSTGLSGGMAQHLARTLGVRVIGPSKDTPLPTIDIKKKKKGLSFKVRYEKGVGSRVYTPSTKVKDIVIVIDEWPLLEDLLRGFPLINPSLPTDLTTT